MLELRSELRREIRTPVNLRGLIIEGGGSRQSTGTGPGFGVYVTSVGFLTVEDCTIRNFLDGLPFLPANTDARLAVYNTSVRNCRFGIDVQAPANGFGIRATVAGSVAGIIVCAS